MIQNEIIARKKLESQPEKDLPTSWRTVSQNCTPERLVQLLTNLHGAASICYLFVLKYHETHWNTPSSKMIGVPREFSKMTSHFWNRHFETKFVQFQESLHFFTAFQWSPMFHNVSCFVTQISIWVYGSINSISFSDDLCPIPATCFRNPRNVWQAPFRWRRGCSSPWIQPTKHWRLRFKANIPKMNFTPICWSLGWRMAWVPRCSKELWKFGAF